MTNIPTVFWLVPIASILALGMALHFFRSMMKTDEGTPPDEGDCTPCTPWGNGISEATI